MVLQIVVNGVVVGASYALIAVGFGLIYSTTEIVHFAHGIVYTWSAYFFYLFSILLGLNSILSFIFAIVASATLAVVIYRLGYEPLLRKNASPTSILIMSIGIFIFLENLVSLIFGSDSKVVSQGPVEEGYSWANVSLTYIQIVIVLTSILICLAIYFMLKWTKWGKAMRAMASDRFMANIVGIKIRKIVVSVFVLGSVLASISAILTSLDVGVRPEMGLSAILNAFIAVIIAGVGNIFGAAFGGFLLGLFQNVAIIPISQRWQDLITFSVLVVVLIVRPTGLFRTKLAKL
jgi:branched-chain amino acid transport system permease protein